MVLLFIRRQAGALAALSVLFAGCVEGAAQDDAGLGSGAAEGVPVTGFVISDELFPVADANVSLVGLASVQSDETGRFEFVSVPAGVEYNLSVIAPGYEPFSMMLDVVNGFEDLRVALVGIPGQAPYVRTLIHDGFDACSISAVYTAGPFPGGPCAFGERKGGMKVEVGPEWRAGVHELSWRTQEDMIFASSVATEDPDHGSHTASCRTSGDTHDWCPAMVWGGSPLKIVARPNDTEYAARFAIDGKETWPGGENYTSFLFASYSGYAQSEINATFYDQCVVINRQFSVPEKWGCPFGVGYSLGIKITYYHTTFYLEAPLRLEEFSALPDG